MSKLPLWLLDPKTYRAILAGLAVSSPLAFAQSYLPTSGALSISAINAIFSRGNNLNAYRGTTYYTSTAGPFTFSSGAISMNSFYGTGPVANRVAISYTFSSNTANASLNVNSIGGYSSGKSDITVTINGGVYLYSTSTGTPGFTISGGASGDTITIVNNGFICGMGGVGGYGRGSPPYGIPGGAGGTALTLSTGISNVTINNTNGSAYIGGGGGGAGSGAVSGSGGGAGGGDGGATYVGYYASAAGGAGGGPGSAGVEGGATTDFDPCTGGGDTYGAGGGGGRIFPGSGGAAGTMNTPPTWGYGGGAGGGGGGFDPFSGTGTGTPGAGGSANAVGNNSNGGVGAGGGGWGALGGRCTTLAGSIGGAGGNAVSLAGRSVTWVSGDTSRVYGSVS